MGYANLHVVTAACPATGQAEGLICQRLNAGVAQLFLDQLSATIPAEAEGENVCDALDPIHNLGLDVGTLGDEAPA